MRDVASDFRGELRMLGQSRSPEGPLDLEPARTLTIFDRAKGRLVQDAENHYPTGFVLTYRTVARPDSGFVVELTRALQGTRIDRAGAQPFEATRAALARELGPYLVLQALDHGTGLRLGVTTHSASAVLAYLPKAGIVYDGDAVLIPPDGPVRPAYNLMLEFAHSLQVRGLAPRVTTIVNTHLGPLPPERLWEAVRQAGAR